MNVALSASDQSDERLLRAYIADRDPAAFAAIVRRHGPTVWTVCRRVLSKQHDAEDAFQATFLILVHKARSVRNPHLLGSWLYGVAYRTSVKARLAASRLGKREKPLLTEPIFDGETEAIWRDLRPVLDDELNRLPSKYRTPVLLCYLEGQSVEQAARVMALPRGTVLTRLAWARQRLRGRLARRGVTLSSALLATLLLKGLAAERGFAISEPLPARLNLRQPSSAAAHLARQVMQSLRAKSLRFAGGMLLVSLLAVWAGLLTTSRYLVPASASHYSSTDEIYQLQGTWNVVAVERFGGSPGDDAVPLIKVFVRGDAVVGCDAAGAESVLFRLDFMSHPRPADFQRGALENLGEQVIFKREGDTLKIAGRLRRGYPQRGRTAHDLREYPILLLTVKCEKAAFSSS